MKKMILGLLVGGFCSLIANDVGRNDEPEAKIRRVNTFLTEGVDFFRIEGATISYEGKNYQEKKRHAWTHDYDKEVSEVEDQSFIVVKNEEIFLGDPVFVRLQQFDEKQGNTPHIWFQTEQLEEKVPCTIDHRKEDGNEYWRHADVVLELEVIFSWAVYGGVEEVVDVDIIRRNLSIEIKDGGRQWCTKQDHYNQRYEPGNEDKYFREAFPNLSKFFV